MVHQIFTSISVILSIIAVGCLFYVSYKWVGGLKTGLNLLAVGILIALTLHAGVEFLSSIGYIGVETLVEIMPFFVMIGCIVLIIGAYILYKQNNNL
jgi:hypothetical protein